MHIIFSVGKFLLNAALNVAGILAAIYLVALVMLWCVYVVRDIKNASNHSREKSHGIRDTFP